MRLPHACSLLPALALTLFAGAAAGAPASAMTYHGLCDASAAVALDADHFVVAGDEDNTLRVYRRGRPAPVGQAPLASFLGSGDKESDLEAAAAVGNRIYWIASHGRNAKGKPRPDRQRFFATDIDARAQPPGVAPAGTPYRGLLDDLAAAPTLVGLRLGDAARLAPEAPGGLNIEGLAAMPDGSLLVGFRNPVPNGRALLVPLLNPAELVTAVPGRQARFGAPILLELRGRGVRSIERALDGRGYWIVAGPAADAGVFSLYRWSGQATDPPRIVDSSALVGLRPEALFELPGAGGGWQILSDDGGMVTDGQACKDRPLSAQRFRSVTLQP